MKIFSGKKILILIFIAFIPLTTFAQSKGARFGVLFGAGQAKVEHEDFLNQSKKIVFIGGLGMTYQLTKNIGVYGNVLFTSKGAKSRGTEKVSGPSGESNYTYRQGLSFYAIEVPLMPKVSIGLKHFYFKVFAGPSINFNIHTNQDKIYDDWDYNTIHGFKDKVVDVPTIEYSFVWGGGLDVEISEKNIFFLEYRRQQDMDLNGINILNNNHYYNKYYTISIGYLHKL